MVPAARGRGKGNGRQPEPLQAWDTLEVHQSDASIAAMADSNTTLLSSLVAGRPGFIQPCHRQMGHLFKSKLRELHQDHIASPISSPNDHDHPHHRPSTGLLAQWVTKLGTTWIRITSIPAARQRIYSFPSTDPESRGREPTRSSAESQQLRPPGGGCACAYARVRLHMCVRVFREARERLNYQSALTDSLVVTTVFLNKKS